jgi:spore coat protein U-like protein
VARLLFCGALLFALGHSELAAKTCKVTVVQHVSFGTYDPLLSGNLDTSGLVRIWCSNKTPNVSVKLDAGLWGGFQPRYMQSGTDQLAYNLYMDASRTTVWGDGTSGTSYFFFAEQNFGRDIPVYGRTPLGQNIPAGSYSDTVVVTVEW